MRYKQFKNADVKVSALGVGTWAIGGQNFGKVDRQEAIRAMREMLEQGVNLIDTAPCYGNGASEQIVGEVLREVPRDEVLISTKVGLVADYHSDGYVKNASYHNIMREVKSSLLNLKTDYIDFYFIHWPDVYTPVAETMAALSYLKKQGTIRYIGVSNFSREQIQEAQEFGQIDVQQPPFSMVDQSCAKLMHWGYENGIDSMTYGSMGAGILSGAIRTMPSFDKKDVRLNFYDFYREPKFQKVMKLLQVMDQVAEKHNRSVAEVAINWSTQKEFVGTALVGARDAVHAKMNCAAFEWELDQEDKRILDDELIRLGFARETE